MEIGYKNTLTYLLQYRDRETGEVTHKLVEAGSTKDAERELRKNMEDRFNEAKLVTSVKSNGEFGDAGNGQLHGENHDLKEVVENLQEA